MEIPLYWLIHIFIYNYIRASNAANVRYMNTTLNHQPISFITIIIIWEICILSYDSLVVVFRSGLAAHLKLMRLTRTYYNHINYSYTSRLIDNMLQLLVTDSAFLHLHLLRGARLVPPDDHQPAHQRACQSCLACLIISHLQYRVRSAPRSAS